NNWNDGANWTSIPPHTVPDGTASFGESTQKSIVFSSNFTSIGSINFSATAPFYTFAITGGQAFVVNGTGAGGGIASSTNSPPLFFVTGALTGMAFFNGATANGAEFAISGSGNLSFRDNSAAIAVINNTNFGTTTFFNKSAASQAVLASLISNDNGGTTSFFNQSNASLASIFNGLNGST